MCWESRLSCLILRKSRAIYCRREGGFIVRGLICLCSVCELFFRIWILDTLLIWYQSGSAGRITSHSAVPATHSTRCVKCFKTRLLNRNASCSKICNSIRRIYFSRVWSKIQKSLMLISKGNINIAFHGSLQPTITFHWLTPPRMG